MSGEAPSPAANGELVVYEAPDGAVRVDVRVDGETVWLTRQQMAALFDRDRSVIARHIRNAFQEGELDREATCAKYAQVRSEGERTVSREVESYSLDVIISVGYRVKSVRGAQFRTWATRTLREHMLRGYTLNQRRLDELGVGEARNALDLLARTLRGGSPADGRGFALADDDGVVVEAVIGDYADTWRLLLEYDEDRLNTLPGACPVSGALGMDRVVAVIDVFRRHLAARGEASPLFGRRQGEVLEAILGNVEQTMFGETLYASLEERAAHLLYFVVKDHPFVDGNKRIGAFLFVLYLKQAGAACRLDPYGLMALTLWIAESAASSKDLMIRLIVNLLADPEG